MERHPFTKSITISLIVLGAVLAVLLVLLVHTYAALRRADLMNRRTFSLSAFVQRHGPLRTNEAGVIRSWMTFGYINTIFGLPQDYLKTQLRISGSRYPNLTLTAYAGSRGIATGDAVTEVQRAVVSYFPPSAPQ